MESKRKWGLITFQKTNNIQIFPPIFPSRPSQCPHDKEKEAEKEKEKEKGREEEEKEKEEDDPHQVVYLIKSEKGFLDQIQKRRWNTLVSKKVSVDTSRKKKKRNVKCCVGGKG